jgi:hypothetical protein
MRLLRRHSGSLRQIALFALVGASLWFVASPAAARDPRVDKCPGATRGNVVTSFDIVDVGDFNRRFPSTPDIPELEYNSGQPGFVVVMKSPITIPVAGPKGNGQNKKEITNAVCVLISDDPYVFTNLDLTGFDPNGS